MNEHPKQPNQNDRPVTLPGVNEFADVHFGTNGGHQNIQEDARKLAGSCTLVGAHGREAQGHPHGGGQEDEPEKVGLQAAEKADRGIWILGQSRIKRMGDATADLGSQEVRQSHHEENDAQQDHQVVEARDSGDAGLVRFDLFLQGIHSGGVGFQALVNHRTHSRADQQEGHPEVGDKHIHDDHDAELVVHRLRNLFECGLIGSAANPASRNGGQPSPQGVGRISAKDVGPDLPHEPQGHRPANDDARGRGKEHDQRFGPQVEDALEVDGQAEHQQTRWQQIPARHIVQVAAFTGRNDAGRIQDGGQEVGHQQGRDKLVETGESGQSRCVEHEGEAGHEQAENGGVLCDHGPKITGRSAVS